MERDVLTTSQAARLLGISVRTAQLLVEGGTLTSWKTPGGHRRVYRDDVLALNPKVVVLLGGTNDLASYKLPDVVHFIEDNLASIVELAQIHHERVILCSLTPVSDAIKPQTDRRDPAKILALNAWIKTFAAERHIPYVDYYAAVSDGHDRIKTELTVDGLHPNQAGVSLMEPLVEAAIAEELKHAK